MTPALCNRLLNSQGWAILPKAVPRDLLRLMRDDLDVALNVCRNIQAANGVTENTVGTVHHLVALIQCRSFLEFLEANPAHPYITSFFQNKPYILQSIGGNYNYPSVENYAGNVHRDIRSYSFDPLMLNTLVALDDLTAENGATWLLSGSQVAIGKPSDETFDGFATQITAPAGSIVLWDSRIWHRAGVNKTGKPRRIITPIFTLPFYKQGLDYCRAIGQDVSRMSPRLQQVLGYKARIPASLSEWYRPKDGRFYQGDQG